LSVQAFARRTRTAARVIRLFVPLAVACAALLLGIAPASAAGPLPPNITSVSVSPQTPRAGRDIAFSAVAIDENAGGAIQSYAWDFDNNGTTDSTQQTPTLTNGFATGGDHKVTVTVTESEGLTASSSRLVHVHALNLPPIVNNVLLDRQSVRAGAELQLFSNAFDPDSNAPLTYDWDFGDGSAHSTAASPTHTYAPVADTNYVATVVVTDSDGAPAMQSVAVAVHVGNRPPVIDFANSFAPNPAPGDDVDMEVDATDDATGVDDLTYSWTFGDGKTSTQSFPTTSYAAAGFYPVTVAADDGEGPGGTSFAGFVQAVGQPAARPSAFFFTDYDPFIFGSNAGTVRTGATVTFYDDSLPEASTTVTSRTWSWGDGTAVGTGAQPTHAFATPGHYMVVETVTDSAGQQDKFGEVITVSDVHLPPEVSIQASSLGPRTGRAVDFSATAFDPDNAPTQANPDNVHVTYDWDFGDGTAHSTAASPSHSYATGGSKTVTLTVTDTDDGLSTQAAKVVLVHAANVAPTPTFTWQPSRPGNGEPVVFSNGTTDDDDFDTLTFTWNFGDGATSTDASPTHPYASAGDYFVTLTASDGNATATEGFTVQVRLDVPPANQTPPTVTGTVEAGQTLAATDGTWNGTRPMTFAHQWQQCDASGSSCVDIAGSNGSIYTIAAGDVGHTIRVRVLATNSGGSSAAPSEETTVVTAAPVVVAPANTAAPTITGTAAIGQLLTAHDGTFSGSPATHTYQWQQCDAAGANCTTIAGATGATYVVAAADVGHTIRVVDTATNTAGHDSSASAPTAVIAAPVVAPANTGAPTITGTAAIGQLLTAHDGTFSGSPAIHSYQWQQCDAAGANCTAIPGATNSTYTPAAADAGHSLRVVDTATNPAGHDSGTSTATAVIAAAAVAPANTTAPTITGTAAIGQLLTEHDGAFSGSATTHTYQWQSCDASGANCTAIAGATRQTYPVAAADVGHTLRVVDTAANSAGSASGTSTATAVVPAAVPPVSAPSVTTAPSVSGTTTVGSTLTAADGTWSGSPAFTRQWQQCDASGGSCADIAGATGATYTVVSADAGHTIRLKVTGTNSAGSVTAVSTQTAAVTAPSGGGGGGGGGGLTVAQIKAKMVGQIAPKGATAKIGQLLAKSGYSLSFTAPVAGTVTIQWYYLPAGSHLLASSGAAPKPILVATGKRSYSKAGKATITVKLSASARKLLKKAKTLKITAKATLTRSGQPKVTATKAFTLKK
jgi:PKD repeat protein